MIQPIRVRKLVYLSMYILNKNSIFKKNKNDLQNVSVEDIRLSWKMLESQEDYIINHNNRKDIIVIGSPDTGIPSAIEFANSLELSYKQFLIKKKSAGRSFILENNKSRLLQVRNKFLIDTNIDIKDKIIFLLMTH